MESQEAKFIAQKIIQEILEGVRSPEQPQSPPTCVTEEEMFHLRNPEVFHLRSDMAICNTDLIDY